MAPVIVPASLTLDRPITRIPFSQNMDLRVSLNPVPYLPEPCPMQRIGPMPERHCFPLPNFSFHWIHPKPQQGRGCAGQCNGCIFLDCKRRLPIGRFGPLSHPTSIYESPPGSALPHCWEYESSEELAGVKMRTAGCTRR